MKGYGKYEVWEGDNWSDGYWKYRARRGTRRIGKALYNPHLSTGEPPSTIPTTGQASILHPFPLNIPQPRDTKQFPTHSKPHTTKEKYYWH